MLNKPFKYIAQIKQDEHDDTANVEVVKSGNYGWNTDSLEWKRLNTDANGKLNVNATASIDTTGLATSTKQSDGSQKTQIVDAGGEAVTVTGGKLDVNATASLAGTALPISGATEAVGVAIVDGSGNQITSFGGGTQYTEGDTDATITGTAALVEGAANALAVMTQPLTDTQLRATPVPVSGTVTANAGTNLNTSALALETTATSIKNAVETIDNAIAGTEMQVDVLTMPTTTVTATDLDIRNLTNTDVVTAELSAVDNAVLDTIAAKDFATQTTLAAINTKLVTGTDIGDVTINNASGASAVNIQDGGNVITVDGTVTANATLAAETTKVIGTVNIAASQTVGLATGSNAIGKLAANSGVDIGDVDVTSLPALAAGTNAIGKLIPPDYDVTSHTAKAQKYYTNAGAVTDGIIWSPAAGKRWHIVSMIINVSADATITLEDDLAAGDNVVWKGEIAAKSGFPIHFGDTYPLASGEDAADLLITTTAGNIYVTCVGYEI